MSNASIILTQRAPFWVLSAMRVVRCLHPQRRITKQAGVNNVLLGYNYLSDYAVNNFCKMSHKTFPY
jgi:hypothetical protein